MGGVRQWMPDDRLPVLVIVVGMGVMCPSALLAVLAACAGLRMIGVGVGMLMAELAAKLSQGERP